MTAINIEALMSMMKPNLLQNSAMPTAQSTGKPDGLFLNLLQSLTGQANGAEAAAGNSAGTAPGDLLATLLSLLAPQGAPDNLLATPDPNSGEATDSEPTLSLTNMMTAVQSLTGQSQTDASVLAQMMQSLSGNSPELETALLERLQKSNADGEKMPEALSIVMQELGMGTNPALMAAMLNVKSETSSPENTVAATVESGTSAPVIPETGSNSQPLPATAQSQPASNVPATSSAQSAAIAGEAASVTIESTPNGTPAKGAPATTAPATQSPAAPAETTSQPFEQTLTRATQTQTTQPTQTPQVTASTQQMTAATAETAQPKKPAQEISLPVANVTQPAPATPAQVIPTPVIDAPASPTLPNIPALHQITDSISMLKQNGQTAVRLNLHPASLGQVMVQLHVTNGDVTVQLLAETSKAHALIQQHLPELKAAFNAQGFGNGSFDVAMGNDASAFNAPRRQPFNWGNPANSNGQSVANGVDGIQPDGTPRGSPPSHLSAGRIDYQV